MYILFLLFFPFFHLKKQKSTYTEGENKGCIYTFLIFLMEKRKKQQKKYVHFLVKKAL